MASAVPSLLVNPRAGRGHSVVDSLIAPARRHGFAVQVLDPGARVEEAAREAAERGATALGIAGGDGSVSAAATVAVERGLPLLPVPTGTLNHFALDVGLSVERPIAAVEAFAGAEALAGREARIDVGRVDGRLFLNNVSVGLYGDLVGDPDYRRHKVRVAWQKLKEALSRDPGERRADDLERGRGADPRSPRGGHRQQPASPPPRRAARAAPSPRHGDAPGNRGAGALGRPARARAGGGDGRCDREPAPAQAEAEPAGDGRGARRRVVRAGIDGEFATLAGRVTVWSEPGALRLLLPPDPPPPRLPVRRSLERADTWLRPDGRIRRP